MGGCSKPLELYWIGMGRAVIARHPVDGGVALYSWPSFGPSQRDRLWLCGAEIYPAPNAAFNISDGGDAIGCAHVAKLSVLRISGINAHASVGAYGCRAEKIQWAGTLQ